mgnify:CR=1 FL=1|tara:strand:- start:2602 stop:3711 length:1110 start_codon:yes stop_codon:yes gene_type:complete
MITMPQNTHRYWLVLLCLFGLLPTANAQIADATALFRDGQIDAAHAMLDELQAQYPNDVDYMLLRAQIYAQQGRIEPALSELRTATSIAPRYEDLWRLRYALLRDARTDDFKDEQLLVATRAAQLFPDATWWRVPVLRSEIEWQVLVGAGYDRLDNDAPSWNQQFIEISRQQDGYGRHHLGIARDERFSTSDITLRIGSDFRFADHWLAGIGATNASSPQFSADSSYRLYLGRNFERGWVATLSAQRRNFSSATVSTTSALIERYVGEFRFAYSLAVGHLHSAGNSLGHSFTSNWYFNDSASIAIAINSGEEAEAIGPGRVLETRVRGITLSGHRDVNDRLTLKWWLGTHDQGDFYRRQFLGMAFSITL